MAKFSFKIAIAVAFFVSISSAAICTESSASSNHKNSQSFDSFTLLLERRIKWSWFPPKMGNLNKPPTVRFEVNKTGRPTNIVLEKSSGDRSLDSSALQALANCKVPGAIPDEVADKMFEYIFDMDALNQRANGPGGRYYPSRLLVKPNQKTR